MPYVIYTFTYIKGKETNVFCYLLLLLLSCFSRVRLCATPWTTAHQTPLFMGFPRQEYWSGFSRVNLNKCFPEGHSVWIPCVYVCGSMYPDVGMVTWDWEGMADTRAVQGCYIQVTVCW